MKNVKLLPYDRFSESCKRLSMELGISRLRVEGSTLKGKAGIRIINWGSSHIVNEEFDKCTWINNPRDVAVAANKLAFFRSIPEFPHFVPWSSSKEDALNWLADGASVFARTTLTSHSGKGIVEMEPDNPDGWVEAPLYTKYMKKKSEFRVHFMNGVIFDVQKKALAPGVDPTSISWKIRNHNKGFNFIRGFGETPKEVLAVSADFIDRTPLNFGALDVIYNERADKAYILEVNTAPGLTGITLENYKNEFIKNYGEL